MGVAERRHQGVSRKHRLRALCTVGALSLALGFGGFHAVAQTSGGPAFGGILGQSDQTNGEADSQLLLEADELIYDFDQEIVYAVGNVQLYYNGTTVEADEVRYVQLTAQVFARGRVKVTQPDGNIIYATEVELTDDLRDGFIEQLVVVSPEDTRFVAASAERRDETVTIFSSGAYTACPDCRNEPEKPPTWQVRAARIIHNKEEKVISYENVRFELFGFPIAWLPFFSHADPTAGRRSGFLRPTPVFSNELGFGVSVPYYFNLAPDYDLTVTVTPYTEQGFLGVAEFRKRFANGYINVRGAGINQLDPDAFVTATIGDREPGNRDWRGSLEASGLFRINDFWVWGFNAQAMSDRTFLRTYDLTNSDELRSDLFLTGRSARNHFDARFVQYQPLSREELIEEQALIHPVIDYNYIVPTTIAGGTVQIDANFLSMSRSAVDFDTFGTRSCVDGTAASLTGADDVQPDSCILRGFDGNMTRLVTEGSWRRTLIGPMGQLITPRIGLRGDVYSVSVNDPWAGTATPEALATYLPLGDRTLARGMASAGAEWRWPFASAPSWGVQTFEPIAQIIVRPNEPNAGELPNEDAISFVFDDTNLFAWDKFSGQDRIEGGTRANVGFHYGMRTHSGMSFRAVVGQSFHLAGTNPFPVDSGLETDRSDYVAAFYFSPAPGFTVSNRMQLDANDFDVERLELAGTRSTEVTTLSVNYIDRAPQPNLGFAERRQEIGGRASIQIDDSWTVFGSSRYNIGDREPINLGFGATWVDECKCMLVTLSYVNSFVEDGDFEEGSQTVMLNLRLRTLGETRVNVSTNELFSD